MLKCIVIPTGEKIEMSRVSATPNEKIYRNNRYGITLTVLIEAHGEEKKLFSCDFIAGTYSSISDLNEAIKNNVRKKSSE